MGPTSNSPEGLDTTTMSSLTLYDLAGASQIAYSPATWQIRLALNYKQLPFNTVWLNLIDIKPTLQRIGASPTVFPAEPEGVYTVPVLVDASAPGPPVVVSHTLPIAEYLDERYPARPLFPPGTKPLLTLYDEHFKQRIDPLFPPLIVPHTLSILPERDKAYFRETRERWLGCKLEEISPPGSKRDTQWEKLKEELEALAGLHTDLSGDGEGKLFVLGDQVSRSDFVLIGYFIWMACVNPDGWETIKTWSGGKWKRLWDASEVWRVNQA
ncbi:hypothetical protein JB92DRAFT_2783896 [Gautieria morchelliformis]|nr:hypothetical protein JB92DRAFT_2783896 [Gautieria morchelliformis]